MALREGAALQVLFSIGDGWKMRGGMPGKPEVMEGAETMAGRKVIEDIPVGAKIGRAHV